MFASKTLDDCKPLQVGLAREHHGTVRRQTAPSVARFMGMKNAQHESHTQKPRRASSCSPRAVPTGTVRVGLQ